MHQRQSSARAKGASWTSRDQGLAQQEIFKSSEMPFPMASPDKGFINQNMEQHNCGGFYSRD